MSGRKKKEAQAPEVLPPATTPIEGSSDLLVGLAQSGDPATLLAAVRGLVGGDAGVLDGAPAEDSPPAAAGPAGESAEEPAREPEETPVAETPATAPPVLSAPVVISQEPAAMPVSAPQGEAPMAAPGWSSPDVDALVARSLATVRASMDAPSQETVPAHTLGPMATPPTPASAPTLTLEAQPTMSDTVTTTAPVPAATPFKLTVGGKDYADLATGQKAVQDAEGSWVPTLKAAVLPAVLGFIAGGVVGVYVVAPWMNKAEDTNVTPLRATGTK